MICTTYSLTVLWPDLAQDTAIEAVEHTPLIVKFRGLYLVGRLIADGKCQGIVWFPHPVIEGAANLALLIHIDRMDQAHLLFSPFFTPYHYSVSKTLKII